ncbi:10039_t:CDS:2 [Diversispora eburnea]|uniref:10039_t:CDS:1 n=1 Tax=Diversispora eburnea TaxID=1213867 RepID=A0A9N9GLL6_9GLOM|nr:10039_t:CDS:2 [Diversispora eburnea]
MSLEPKSDLMKKNYVISKSGIYEQHQGLDAILEEVNKNLKTLIPPVPQYHHWIIAALFSLEITLLKIIGYNDYQTIGPRTPWNAKDFEPIYEALNLPIQEEAKAQESEENMTKSEILLMIETLLEQLGENTQKKYSGIKSKKRSELLCILQEIKRTFNSGNEIINEDCLK